MELVATEKIKVYKEPKFLYSPIYALILSALVYVCWYFDLAIFGITAFLVLSGVLLIFCRDTSPLIPIPFLIYSMINTTYYNDSYAIWCYLGGFICLVAGFITHLIRFRPSKARGKIKGITTASVFLLFSIMIGGVNQEGGSLYPTLIAFFLPFALGIILLFLSFTMGRDNSERALDTVIFSVLLASIIAVAQFVTYVLKSGDIMGFFATMSIDSDTSSLDRLASIMARGVPVLFYYASKKNKAGFLCLIPALILSALVVLTNSRISIFMLAVVGFIFLIFFFVRAEHKISYGITALVLIIGSGVSIWYFWSYISPFLSSLISQGFNDIGSIDLWAAGINAFLRNPVFGTGLDYNLGGNGGNALMPYWYHNTFIQAGASFGLIGIVALLIYLYCQYRTVLTQGSNKAYCVAGILILIFAIAILDIYFYTTQTLLQMSILTLCVAKCLPENRCNSCLYDFTERMRKQDLVIRKRGITPKIPLSERTKTIKGIWITFACLLVVVALFFTLRNLDLPISIGKGEYWWISLALFCGLVIVTTLVWVFRNKSELSYTIAWTIACYLLVTKILEYGLLQYMGKRMEFPLEFSAVSYVIFGLTVVFRMRKADLFAVFAAILSGLIYLVGFMLSPAGYLAQAETPILFYMALINHTLLYFGGMLMLCNVKRYKPTQNLQIPIGIGVYLIYVWAICKYTPYVSVNGKPYILSIVDGSILQQILGTEHIQLWTYCAYLAVCVASIILLMIIFQIINDINAKRRVRIGLQLDYFPDKFGKIYGNSMIKYY